MKRNATLALVLCLAVLGTATEARADCRYVRGSIAETRISLETEPTRILGNVTGVLNGAVTVTIISPPPDVRSFLGSAELMLWLTFEDDELDGPVLERQPLHAPELGRVVRHERQRETACVGSYEQIVGANHLTPPLQVCPDRGIVGCGLISNLQNLDVRKECVSAVASCVRRGDTSTPYSSSDLVMTEMHTSLTATARRRFRTTAFDRFMM